MYINSTYLTNSNLKVNQSPNFNGCNVFYKDIHKKYAEREQRIFCDELKNSIKEKINTYYEKLKNLLGISK